MAKYKKQLNENDLKKAEKIKENEPRFVLHEILIITRPTEKMFAIYDRKVNAYLFQLQHRDNALSIINCLECDAIGDHYLDKIMW